MPTIQYTKYQKTSHTPRETKQSQYYSGIFILSYSPCLHSYARICQDILGNTWADITLASGNDGSARNNRAAGLL